MLRYDGKVALITGGGRGLGRAHAELLAARGCKVVINDLGVLPTGDAQDEDPAAEAAAAIRASGGEAISNRYSVLGEAKSMIQSALDTYGRLDILICNAGTNHGGLFADLSAEHWQRLVDIHYRGTVEVTRAAWSHLIASGAGRVVTTASTGMFGNPRATNYGSAKAAIFGFTKALAPEGLPHGVNVNCVLPTAWTRMTQTITDARVGEALARRFAPEHVAAFVGWLVHESTKVTNEGFAVGGGFAQRVVFAVGDPMTAITGCSPDAWVGHEQDLLDAELVAMPSMLASFGQQLLALNEGLDDVVDGMMKGGVNSRVPGEKAV